MVTTLRLELRTHRLLNESITITEIAWRCGFSSPQHFSNTFKLKTGVSLSGFLGLNNIIKYWQSRFSDPSKSYNTSLLQKRVIRGGSFLCNESYCTGCRVARRMKSTEDDRMEHLGFRCVQGNLYFIYR